MRKQRLFINYRLLWREIQDSNKFKIAHTSLLRRGNSYVLYELCNRYKDLLNQIIRQNKVIDPNNLPTLYIGSSDIYKHSPYQMKSITNSMQALMHGSYSHLIHMESIFNDSKFMVCIPLRYFFTLSWIEHTEVKEEINKPKYHRRF